MDLRERRKRGLSFTKWAKYLVTNLKYPKMLKASSLLEVETRVTDIGSQREQTYTSSHAEAGFNEGTSFQSYHYQALKPLSEEVRLA